MNYYLGLDNGGTFVKAVLFDENGQTVSRAAEHLETLLTGAGRAERNMEQLWQKNCSVIHAALERAQIDPHSIRCISFSGHGKGLYPVDQAGNAYTNGIVSTDTRAYHLPLRWNADGTAAQMRTATLQGLMACQPVCLLKWLQENESDVLERAGWFFGVKDYIRFRMTGVAAAELTDFSGSGLVNLSTRSYDMNVLTLAGLSDLRARLPHLLQSTDFAGRVTGEAAAATGLAEGTPCAAGLFDIDACALGMQVIDGSRVAMIAGTWGINEFIAPCPVTNGSIRMNSLYALPGWYLLEESSPTSASNFDWFVQTFLKDSWLAHRLPDETLYAYADRLAEEVPIEEPLPVWLPYLYGGNQDERAEGCLVGATANHTPAHFVRSVLEGVVFCHRQQLEALLQNRERPQAIRLSGGVCHSPFWVQMFADVLGLPIELSGTDETGALGTALTAAVACGDFPDLVQAAQHMVRLGTTVLPNCGRTAIYEKKYQRYQLATQQLLPLWPKWK